MITQKEVQGNWKKFQGNVKKYFGKLTDDELIESKGDAEVIIGDLVETYGITKEKATQKWNDFLSHFDSAGNEIESLTDNISETLNGISDKTVHVAKKYQQMAQDKPLLALGIAVLAGCVVGMLVSKF